ncbi:hypothetical protein MAA_04295 [Metarhizium robertsii ARSEF 23]|nr:uncharacterized protein MAA_04295 [Metarhizium robertsii ARSEF 23]EFZ00518.2 hypothetical protein MAA_04295 [Metarhizium robertsii ARSEF 23]
MSSPHAMPWAALLTSQEDYGRALDNYRYPAAMQALSYKQTWTGLVMEKGYTFERLTKLPDGWHHLGFPDSFEGLGPLLDCDMSHNLGGTMLYLGSNAGEHAITKAVAILDNLLQCALTISDHKHHLIYNESEGKTKFVYKYLSQIGLLQTTYATSQDMKTEYRLLRSAVTIRTATKRKDGWKSDSTSYPCKGGIEPKKTKSFSVFNGYRYKSKEASAISNLFKKAEVLILQDQQATQQGPNVDLLTACEGGSSSPGMGTASTDGISHTTLLKTTITSRFSPRFPTRHASNDSLKSENLICFDEDINIDCSRGQLSSKQQQSLLDDCAPIELMELIPLSSTSTTLPLESTQNDNQSLPSSHMASPLPPGDCSMEKTIHSSGRPRVDTEIARSLEERIKSLASMMQFAPGHATVRLKFGRFYIVNFAAEQVDVTSDFNGPFSGPFRRMANLLDDLEDATPSGHLRFSTVLSTIGPDADAIAGTSTPIPMWTKPVIEIILRVTCNFKGETFFVEINADTFDYTCQGPVIELGSVLVHCPQHPWDIKVCGDSSKNLDMSVLHRVFGQIIVNSLHINPVPNGITALELTANEKLGLVIEGVAICHVAKYSSTNTMDSNLSVVMTQKLSPGDTRDNRRQWSVFKRQGDYNPKMWFEAYLTSSRMEKIMQENSGLSIGGRSSWSSEDLSSQGLFFSLYGPALKMIGSLDKIGHYNDNGQSNDGGLTFGNSLAEEDARKGPVRFW